jgi:hypothetical protein
VTTPTWDEATFPPCDEITTDIVGTAIEGARSLSGLTGALDISGGGFWRVDWGIDLGTESQQRAFNRMAARLNGSVRTVNVTFLTDNLVAFDTSLSVATTDDRDLNEGTIKFAVPSTALLEGGETFSINHPTRGWRAYRIAEIDSITGTSTKTYTVGIRPPLREATDSGTALEWALPRCLMRLMPGTTMSLRITPVNRVQQTVSFIEAFEPA